MLKVTKKIKVNQINIELSSEAPSAALIEARMERIEIVLKSYVWCSSEADKVALFISGEKMKGNDEVNDFMEQVVILDFPVRIPDIVLRRMEELPF